MPHTAIPQALVGRIRDLNPTQFYWNDILLQLIYHSQVIATAMDMTIYELPRDLQHWSTSWPLLVRKELPPHLGLDSYHEWVRYLENNPLPAATQEFFRRFISVNPVTMAILTTTYQHILEQTPPEELKHDLRHFKLSGRAELPR